MRIKIGLLVAALALLSLPALAQNGNSEVSANFTGNFQKQADGMGVLDTSTDSGGFVVNYRYHFNKWSAVEANYGNTLFSQVYNSGTVTRARVQETTFAYVFTFGVDRESPLPSISRGRHRRIVLFSKHRRHHQPRGKPESPGAALRRRRRLQTHPRPQLASRIPRPRLYRRGLLRSYAGNQRQNQHGRALRRRLVPLLIYPASNHCGGSLHHPRRPPRIASPVIPPSNSTL